MMRALAASGASRVSLVALSRRRSSDTWGSRAGGSTRGRSWSTCSCSRRSRCCRMSRAGGSARPWSRRRWGRPGPRSAGPVPRRCLGLLRCARLQSRRVAGLRAALDAIPEQAFQVALLPRHEPWMVGRLIYPEAFWATDTVGLRDPRLAGSRTCRSTPPTRAASRPDRRVRRPTCRAPPGPAVASVRPGRRWPAARLDVVEQRRDA